MMPASWDVIGRVRTEALDNDGEAVEVSLVLKYSAADPYAVTGEFGTGDMAVEWSWARVLLRVGLLAPCGDGEIKLWPVWDPERPVVALLPHTGPGVLLRLEESDVERFLARTVAVVAFGAERPDVDGAIERCLTA